MACPKCGKDHSSAGAICGGVGMRYQARARLKGHREWRLVGKPSTAYHIALRRMAAAFAKRDSYKADVIMWAEYYDPVQLCELVRR